MIVAASVDLFGVPASVVADALARLPITGFHVHFGTRARMRGIVATSFEVHVDEGQPGTDLRLPIRAMIDGSDPSPRA